MLKQYIIVRKDLVKTAPVGKMMSQAAHAAVGACNISLEEDIKDWELGQSTKITLAVKNEFQLLKVISQLESFDIPFAKIIDAGRTVFDGETLTCVGVGPIHHDDLESITKKLQLLQ